MRKQTAFVVSILAAVSLFSLAACQSNEVDVAFDVDIPGSVERMGQEVIITATTEDPSPETRTETEMVVDENNHKSFPMYWLPGDKIMIYSAGEASEFTSINTERARLAKFRGYVAVVTGADDGTAKDYVYGIYPSSSVISYSEPEEISETAVIRADFPAMQESKAGSYASGYAMMLGRAESLSIYFKSVYSCLYFTFDHDDVFSITLRGLNNETLAGQVDLTMVNNEPVATPVAGQESKEVTMIAPDGGAFVPGQEYYMLFLPQVFQNGFSLTLKRRNGMEGTYQLRSTNLNLSRNSFTRLATPDLRIENQTNIDNGTSTGWHWPVPAEGNIVFADPAVKTICVTNWDTDGDGELSYVEAAAVTTIPYDVFSGNREISSFDEFQYFTGITELDYYCDSSDEGSDYFGAFSYSTLKSIKLPPSLETISYGAFRGCEQLEEITIPATVTTIQQVAFLGCSNKKLVVIMESETPPVMQGDYSVTYPDPSVFGWSWQINAKAILVPTDEAVSTYKSTQYWSTYSSIIHKIGWVDPSDIITFQDALTELYCVEYWDTDGDEKLSYAEAAAVTDLGTNLQGTDIVYFEELKYFTGLTSLPNEAFKNCQYLKSISIPSSIEGVEANVFNGCYKLNKVSVPSLQMWMDIVSLAKPFANQIGDLYIGDNLVINLVIPDGRTSVNDYLCCNLNKLESVSLPNSVTSIGNYAFYGCCGLTSIIIPDGVSAIGDYAFGKCTGIASITIPDSVTSIGTYSFYGCSSLSSATLPQETRTLPAGIFSGCAALSSVSPDSYYSIGDFAFNGCAIESITVTGWIGKYAFQNCKNMSSITLIDGFNRIQRAAFSGCDLLKEISLPESVGTLTNALYDAIIDPYLGLSYEMYGAFYGSSIESIECYDNLLTPVTGIKIGDTGVTYDNSNLNAAFKFIYKSSISKWTYKNTLSTLKRVTVKKSSTTYSIPQNAFAHCTALETVNLPTGLTSVGYWSFYNCTSLESFDFQATLRGIGERAFGRCAFKHIALQEGLTSIGFAAFADCKDLESILLPESLDEIGQIAFQNCTGLTEVIIPGGVSSIGANAFSNCSSLAGLTVSPATPPTLGQGALNGTYPIYVPAGSVDTYKTADGWSAYADRIQCMPSQAIQLQGISLTPALNLSNGSTMALTPTFTPADATNKNVIWATSNSSIATVDSQGNVTAVGNGTATITVTTEDGGFTANCIVTVNTSGKPFPEGTTFDEDAYITYVANSNMYFIGDDQYFMVSTFPCDVRGTKIEMKFQMDQTATASLNSSVLVDGFLYMNDYNLYWGSWTSGVSDNSIVQFGNGVALSDIMTLTANLDNGVLTTDVNGVQNSFAYVSSQIWFEYLFYSFEKDHDEGTEYDYYAGVPDGARLYYVKIWDASGNLVYFGHAAKALNSSTSQEEYCWYSVKEGIATCTFAYNNGSSRQPFGGGID